MLSILPPPDEPTLEERITVFRDKYQAPFEIACEGLDAAGETGAKLGIIPKRSDLSVYNSLPASAVVRFFFDNINPDREPDDFKRLVPQSDAALYIRPKRGLYPENSPSILGKLQATGSFLHWDKSYQMKKVFQKFRDDLAREGAECRRVDAIVGAASGQSQKVEDGIKAMDFIIENFEADYVPLARDISKMRRERYRKEILEREQNDTFWVKVRREVDQPKEKAKSI
jgi:hypothetical protein